MSCDEVADDKCIVPDDDVCKCLDTDDIDQALATTKSKKRLRHVLVATISTVVFIALGTLFLLTQTGIVVFDTTDASVKDTSDLSVQNLVAQNTSNAASVVYTASKDVGAKPKATSNNVDDDTAVSEQAYTAQSDNQSSYTNSTNSANTSSAAKGTDGAYNNSNNTTGESGPTKVWHPGWEEQVWQDTSHYETVMVDEGFENPVNEVMVVCSVCLEAFPISFDIVIGHSLPKHDGFSGWRTELRTTSYKHVEVWVSKQVWKEEGHWETVYHDGYWS